MACWHLVRWNLNWPSDTNIRKYVLWLFKYHAIIMDTTFCVSCIKAKPTNDTTRLMHVLLPWYKNTACTQLLDKINSLIAMREFIVRYDIISVDVVKGLLWLQEIYLKSETETDSAISKSQLRVCQNRICFTNFYACFKLISLFYIFPHHIKK